ncbi:MAG: UbiA family prenyltransferase [Deinococcales bacterium]
MRGLLGRGADAAVRAWVCHPFVRHLRLHFNVLLSPIYLWGVLLAGGRLGDARVWLGYLAVHVFLYGGATAFNSYYDRDEGPVGGMLRPPGVTPGLLPFSLVVQAFGVPLALVVGGRFVLTWTLLFLGFAAYSHPWVRLKARLLGALSAIALGQGALGFALGWLAVAPAGGLATVAGLTGMASAALVVLGLYVVTQSYQTLEDRRRGDRTLPVLLGPRRALRVAVVFLAVGGAVMMAALAQRAGVAWLVGVLAFFVGLGTWMLRWAARFDERAVERNFRVAMGLAAVSSGGFTAVILALLA